jgi:hypothetical protein
MYIYHKVFVINGSNCHRCIAYGLNSSLNNGAVICDEGYFITIFGFAFLPAIVPTNTIDTTDISVAVRNIRLYD